ncbi:MAG: OmpA family protein, partial [Burkholderiales bacterium]|nr:OmpA family protein [Burkholderiales bacterium]
MLKKISALIALGISSASTMAQIDIHVKTPVSAYIQDGHGNIVRSSNGLCWKSGYWTPADAINGCDALLTVNAPQVTTKSEIPVPAITPPVAAMKATPAKRCDFAMALQNDETFDFNKSILKQVAKNHIDNEVLPKLNACAKLNLIIVTGHTDLIGAHRYNQKLSEKRAEAVASYLKSKGIAADINTMGMGKTQQIKACDENVSINQRYQCLAPNRRVVIEGR